MKVYLAVPLVQNTYKNIAKKIYHLIIQLNCKINSEWVIWDDPNPNLNSNEIYLRDLNAIKSADVVIAEITKPSIGVGMEIMLAKTFAKRIICISQKKKFSKFLVGTPDITIIHYSSMINLSKKLRSEFLAFHLDKF